MVRKNFVEICHSCGKEVLTCNEHLKAKLVDSVVYFHPHCYLYYVKQAGDVLKNVLKYKPQ